MSIIPRANPEDIHQISPLPGVRNETQVRPLEGISQAFGSVVSGVDKLYQQHVDRVDMTAFMDAQRQLSDWQDKWQNPDNPNGVSAYKGENASGLHGAMIPDYDGTVQQIALNMPSRRARDQFMRYSMQRREQLTDYVNRYTTSEGDHALAAKQQAWELTAQDSASQSYFNNPAGFVPEMASIHDTLAANLASQGYGPEVLDQKWSQVRSNINTAIVSRLQSEQGGIAAKAFYDAHESEFTERDRASVLPGLSRQTQEQTADDDAAVFFNGGSMGGKFTPKPGDQNAAAIAHAADQLAIDPVTLGTIIGFESGFNPDAHNASNHHGVIQFSADNQRRYGIRPGMSLSEQMPAVVAYLRDVGVKPGMDEAHVYAAVLAGDPNAIHAGDVRNGGRVRDIADMVKTDPQWRAARNRAEGMFVSSGEVPIAKPQTEADAVEAMRTFAKEHDWDVARIASTERGIRGRFADQRQRDNDNERAMGEQLFKNFYTPENANKSFDALLDTSTRDWLVRTGKYDAFKSAFENHVSAKDDPDTANALQEIVYRAADTSHPAAQLVAQRQLKDMNPYDPTLPLSMDTRAKLGSARLSLLDGKKNDGKTDSIRSESDQRGIGLAQLGLTNPKKNKDDIYAFTLALQQAYESFALEHPERKPTIVEANTLRNEVVRQFAIRKKNGGDTGVYMQLENFGGFGSYKADFSTAAGILRQRLGREPTTEEVVSSIGKYYEADKNAD